MDKSTCQIYRRIDMKVSFTSFLLAPRYILAMTEETTGATTLAVTQQLRASLAEQQVLPPQK